MAFPSGWGRKQKISISNTQVSGSGSHSDFPVLVTLDHLNAEIVDAGSNSGLNGGGDIRFSSDVAGATQLACEIVSFVTNASAPSRECEIWVKVPSVSTSADTDFYIWYNKSGETQPAVTATYGRNEVWSGYEFLSHDMITDSTGNHTITQTNAGTTADSPWGKDAMQFNGSSNNVNVSNIGITVNNAMTWSFWGDGQPSNDDTFPRVMTLYDGNTGMMVAIDTEGSNSNNWVHIDDNLEGWQSDTADNNYPQWDHVVASHTTSSTGERLRVNKADEIDNGYTGWGSSDGATNELTIANDGNSNYYGGKLAHFGIRLSQVSNDVTDTEYNMMNAPASFATAGTPEDNVTDVTFRIAPSGGDYTSLSAYVTAEAANLVTAGEQHILEFETFSGGLDDNTFFPGITTGPDNKLILRAAVGHEHNGISKSGFYFERGGSSTAVFRPQTGNDHIYLENIEVNNGVVATSGNGGEMNDTLNLLVSDSNGDGITTAFQGNHYNPIVINAGDDGIIYNKSGGEVVNATVYGSGNRGIVAANGTFRNCIAVSSTNDDWSDQGASCVDCLASDTTAFGTGALDSRTVQQAADLPLSAGDYVIFEDTTASSEDLTLVDDSENDAVDAGTYVSANLYDAKGDLRPNPPSIGALEPVEVVNTTLVLSDGGHNHSAENLTITGNFPVADFSVQHISDDIGNSGGTNTSFTAISDLNSALELANNNRKSHAGSVSSTGNMEGDDMAGGRVLTGTSTLTYYRESGSTSDNMRFETSVMEYVGDLGGDNEFIVRGRFATALNGATNSVAETLSNVSDAKDCIPFISGIMNNATTDDFDSSTALAYLENATTLRVQKGSNGNNVTVYVTVVEFTGSNWTVLHGDSGDVSADTGTITLYDGSDGTGTATNVSAWGQAVIFGHHRADTGASGTNDAIADNWPVFDPGSNDQTVDWTFDANHDSAGTNRHFVHILDHADLSVTRYQDTSNTQGESTIDITTAGLTSIDQALIVGFSISSGSGTALGRGSRNYYFNSATQAAHWAHRSGNTMSHEIQIVDVSAIASAAGGDTLLAIAKGTHSHDANDLALTQVHALSVQDCTHGHTPENLEIVENIELGSQGSVHGHAAENLEIIQAIDLVVSQAGHNQMADEISIAQIHEIDCNSALHNHTSEILVFVENIDLTLQDAGHVHSAEGLNLVEASDLALAGAIHSHNAQNVAISQADQLGINYGLHGHLTDELVFTQIHNLGVDGTTHAHSADNCTLSEGSSLEIAASIHGQLSENLILTENIVLSIGDGDHNHGLENLVLSQFVDLSITDGLHGHLSENIVLDTNIDISVQSSVHAFLDAGLVLGYQVNLVVQDAEHNHFADQVLFTQNHVLLVQNSDHEHSSENLLHQIEVSCNHTQHDLLSDHLDLPQVHILGLTDDFLNHSADAPYVRIPPGIWGLMGERVSGWLNFDENSNTWSEHAEATDSWSEQSEASDNWTEQQQNSNDWHDH